jgi:Spy/CpxP family protein refolding chaperone
MTKTLWTAMALVAGLAAVAPALAQDGTGLRMQGQGQEAANFGLTPFTAVPQITLTEAAMAQVRALEDSQLRARRALEDRFAEEMRALLATQAEERAALIRSLGGGQ